MHISVVLAATPQSDAHGGYHDSKIISHHDSQFLVMANVLYCKPLQRHLCQGSLHTME